MVPDRQKALTLAILTCSRSFCREWMVVRAGGALTELGWRMEALHPPAGPFLYARVPAAPAANQDLLVEAEAAPEFGSRVVRATSLGMGAAARGGSLGIVSCSGSLGKAL